ncbi:MAG TPA: hypothetical protein VFO16_09765 [Pseudonocardiaceae bacterium]|nr:hypothetical protein [Pseudonocardiaceae bacterium]
MAFTKQRWVIGGLVVVGILLLFSEHGRQFTGSLTSPGPTTIPSEPAAPQSCTVTVKMVTPLLIGPHDTSGVAGTLNSGVEVQAETTPLNNGYRKLGPGLWAAQGALSDCH